jgi:hypothetical protein
VKYAWIKQRRDEPTMLALAYDNESNRCELVREYTGLGR